MRRIALLACILALLAALWKRIDRAREGARWAQCFGDFKGIALGLHNYHAEYGSLPPAYLTDASGRPTLSWRVVILPFMEQKPLYNAFNLSEPWDSPTNIKLLGRMPGTFACPNRYAETGAGLTKCVAVVGPGTMFPGARPARFADVRDGLDRTIMLAEVEGLAVPWTAPVDLDIRTMSLRINDPQKPSISSPHPKGPAVSMGDGMLRIVPRSLPPGSLRALITAAGGESLDAEAAFRQSPHED
jgi:hypothetical protein